MPSIDEQIEEQKEVLKVMRYREEQLCNIYFEAEQAWEEGKERRREALLKLGELVERSSSV